VKRIILADDSVPFPTGGSFRDWSDWLQRLEEGTPSQLRSTAILLMGADTEIGYRVIGFREETRQEKLDSLAAAKTQARLAKANYDELKWKLESEGLTGK